MNIYDGPAAFLEDFARLRPELGHLFAARWCEAEVCNGGFHQFFTNPTGVLAPEAARGFRAIGLVKCAAIVEQAMTFFGPVYPRDQDKRLGALKQVHGDRRDEWDPFFDLDRQFFELLDTENGGFLHAADDYAERVGR